MPAWASAYAVQVPMMPPPMMATSTASGSIDRFSDDISNIDNYNLIFDYYLSINGEWQPPWRPRAAARAVITSPVKYVTQCDSLARRAVAGNIDGRFGAIHPIRSEEHTSELQSRENLVC